MCFTLFVRGRDMAKDMALAGESVLFDLAATKHNWHAYLLLRIRGICSLDAGSKNLQIVLNL